MTRRVEKNPSGRRISRLRDDLSLLLVRPLEVVRRVKLPYFLSKLLAFSDLLLLIPIILSLRMRANRFAPLLFKWLLSKYSESSKLSFRKDQYSVLCLLLKYEISILLAMV